MTAKKVPNIYQRLHAVMKDVSYVQKEDKKVNNQYTFVSHDAVTAAVRPALIEHGIIYHPTNLTWTQNGNRTELSLDINFINIDKPDDCVLVPSFGFGIDQQDKGPGKAMSYAVKYAILKALGLETGDDPERDSIEHSPPKITPLDNNEKREFSFTKEDHDKLLERIAECIEPSELDLIRSDANSEQKNMRPHHKSKIRAAIVEKEAEFKNQVLDQRFNDNLGATQ